MQDNSLKNSRRSSRDWSADRHDAWTLTELIVALAILAVLLSFLLPAVQASRLAAQRIHCQSNLRGWGQAVQAYVVARGRYPPAATWREGQRADGRPVPPRHSVFTYLLPFWDEQPLSEYVDLNKDWNDPSNESWAKQWLGGILICPTAPERPRDKHPADYTVAVRVDPSELHGIGRLLRQGLVWDRSHRGPPDWGAKAAVWNGLLSLEIVDYTRQRQERTRVRPRDVLDGISKTVLMLENAGKPICYRDRHLADCHITRFRWASPTIWMTINDVCRGQQLTNCHNNSQPYSFHRGGLNMVYADGSVHWFSETGAANLFVSAITRSGRD